MNSKERECMGMKPLIEGRPDLKEPVEMSMETIVEHPSNESDVTERGPLPDSPIPEGPHNARSPWKPKGR